MFQVVKFIAGGGGGQNDMLPLFPSTLLNKTDLIMKITRMTTQIVH